MALTKINGRTFWHRRLADLHRVKPGRFEGSTTNGLQFVIDGGRALGGSRRDWFLTVTGWEKPIICTSIVDAVNLICNA